ncbi:MAG: hypothetical protein WKF73_04075 [Nocardioidaceae bacterium]
MFDSMPMQMGLTIVIVVVGAVLLVAGLLLVVRMVGARERDQD